jgi:hypothetical protein
MDGVLAVFAVLGFMGVLALFGSIFNYKKEKDDEIGLWGTNFIIGLLLLIAVGVLHSWLK